jgi:predicted nuclease with RNAse H fold
MRYCGVVPMQRTLQLAMLEELRTPEPPVRLTALFFEPGTAAQVAAELRSLGDVVVGVGAPLAGPREDRPARDCDALLSRRGVIPHPATPEARELAELLGDLTAFQPITAAPQATLERRRDEDERVGQVEEGSYHDFPLFETNADGVFCALQGRRLPARRHPLGLQLRIEELEGDHVIDEGGDLWHRRVEELDAAACALCAHRYAVGHASWLGDPEEAVVVLPGASVPHEFSRQGVLPPVERLRLPDA